MLLLFIPWFLFLLIHVIAVAGRITELSFCVRLRLESLIRVQHAMTGSKKTLIRRSPIIPIAVSMTQSGTMWIILTIIGVIGLLLIMVFFDPVMACCTLIRDSSLSITQKLSSIIVPATAITWMSKKRNQGINSSNIDDFEMRVSDLENQMSVFTVFINNDMNTKGNRRLEFIEDRK